VCGPDLRPRSSAGAPDAPIRSLLERALRLSLSLRAVSDHLDDRVDLGLSMGRPRQYHPETSGPPVPTEGQKRELLAELELLNSEIDRRVATTSPITYGLPDLLFDKDPLETEDNYRKRQDAVLRSFLTEQIKWRKEGDAEFKRLVLIDEQLRFIADLFFRRVDLAIVWKGRGCGGSLCASVLIWIVNVFHKQSYVNLAGSADQAKVVFGYVKEFWNFYPDFKRNMLVKDPTAMELQLVTGIYAKCITGSEKAARGKHPPCLLLDESCQRDDRTNDSLLAAMQTPLSEQDRMIALTSTFHHPVGLFQEVWDFAKEKGFTRYLWDVFDSMAPCKMGLETATEDDPDALEYCREQCPLTRKDEVRDNLGRVIDYAYKECAGKARKSKGWMTYDQVLSAKRLNQGTTVFQVEFCCERPEFQANIYSTPKIDMAVSKCELNDQGNATINWSYGTPKAIGVDWGMNACAIVLVSLEQENGYMAVLEHMQFAGVLVPEVARLIGEWHQKYLPNGAKDPIPVYCDASHPYNNLELARQGFWVEDVPFNRFKEYGIGNVGRFFNFERLRILPDFTVLLRQLRGYRRGRDGKPVKREDHGPDSLLCALMHFQFTDVFQGDIQQVGDKVGIEEEEVLEF